MRLPPPPLPVPLRAPAWQALPDEITLAKEPPLAPLQLSCIALNSQPAPDPRIASWTLPTPLSVHQHAKCSCPPPPPPPPPPAGVGCPLLGLLSPREGQVGRVGRVRLGGRSAGEAAYSGLSTSSRLARWLWAAQCSQRERSAPLRSAPLGALGCSSQPLPRSPISPAAFGHPGHPHAHVPHAARRDRDHDVCDAPLP